jgi:hypothetical protein
MLLAVPACGGLAADAAARAEQKCRKIHAQISSTPTQEGCNSPAGLCTAGTIDGNMGLDGKTYFTADEIAPGPSTAPDAPATVSYSGILVITTRHGTLTTRDTGIFNTTPEGTTPTGGFFASFDLVLEGTGRYANANGTFLTAGRTVNGAFESDVDGRICLR